ncbi:MAG: DUF4037 domain-containing protein [Clostridia bacterium]
MKGIELAEQFYNEYKIDLQDNFPDYVNRIAIGLAGQGSECYGYDDEYSRDHDYKVGFCLWLTRKDEEAIGFKLMRWYNNLPKEYSGISMRYNTGNGEKLGVQTIPYFFDNLIGMSTPPSTPMQWLSISEQALANATNGKVFVDRLGEFSTFRETLIKGMPLDVVKKKLSAHLALMAQSGRYNYERCILHGEVVSAQLSLNEFVDHAVSAIFNLNRAYRPFYKWTFRALKDLPLLSNLALPLSQLLTNTIEDTAKKKAIESVIDSVCREVEKQELSLSKGCDIDELAYSVQSSITNRQLLSMHIMEY